MLNLMDPLAVTGLKSFPVVITTPRLSGTKEAKERVRSNQATEPAKRVATNSADLQTSMSGGVLLAGVHSEVLSHNQHTYNLRL